jgi:hypothetical protein
MQKEEVQALKTINRIIWVMKDKKMKMINKMTKKIWKWVMIHIIMSTMFMTETINEYICLFILFI